MSRHERECPLCGQPTEHVWMSVSDVAEYLGVKVGTIGAYSNRSQMPDPDKRVGRRRVKYWTRATIDEWRRKGGTTP